MRPDPQTLKLYLCADPAFCGGRSLAEAVEAAVAGGVTVVQLRDKGPSARDFYKRARELRALTRRLAVPLIINDRLDIALAAEADGVHLGRLDLPPAEARRIAGEGFIIGVSAHSAAEARAAEREGADYLGSGAVFPTGSKADASSLGLQGLRQVREAAGIPVVGIGGIGAENAALVMASGVAGIAVISAILSQGDMEAAARRLRKIVDGAPF